MKYKSSIFEAPYTCIGKHDAKDWEWTPDVGTQATNSPQVNLEIAEDRCFGVRCKIVGYISEQKSFMVCKFWSICTTT